MKARKSGAVAIFIGVLLIVVFAVGLIVQKNPSALISKYRYDLRRSSSAPSAQTGGFRPGSSESPSFSSP